MPKLLERIDKKSKSRKRNYSVTIPAELIDILLWKKGDDLYLSRLDDDAVKIVRVKKG